MAASFKSISTKTGQNKTTFLGGSKQTKEALLIGFIRGQVGNKYIAQIPADIISFLIAYITLFEPVIFDIFNSKNCLVSDDWSVYQTSESPQKPNCHRVFISSQGYDRGVVYWKLKSTQVNSGNEGGIGICSGFNKAAILNERPWINDSTHIQDCVWWSLCGKTMKMSSAVSILNEGQRKLCRWKSGDTITVELNCQKWYIQFYLNDEEMKDAQQQIWAKVNIPKNKTYYPIFATYYADDVYEVLLQ